MDALCQGRERPQEAQFLAMPTRMRHCLFPMQLGCRIAASAAVETAVGALAALARDILGLEPGDGVVEALGAVAIAGIVGAMTQSGIGDLLLQQREVLIFGVGEVGEVEGRVLNFLVEALQGGPAEQELGEMRARPRPAASRAGGRRCA